MMGMRLIDPTLGTLELRDAPYAVASFQIGSRSTRDVVRTRALADGIYDDTRHVGGRAVTIAMKLNEAKCPAGTTMQGLYDLLLPYLSPRRRPTLQWELPGSPGVIRQLTVRGANAPVIVNGHRHLEVVAQFVSDGEITSPTQHTSTITPSEDVELGRPYDLVYDRNYPASLGPGDRLLVNNGNERAHWVASIFGIATNPTLTINGVVVDWTQTLVAGDRIVIDTRERTMFFNDDIAEPRYHVTNYTAWSWDDLLLEPGQNSVRFSADTLGAGGSVAIAWSDTWAG